MKHARFTIWLGVLVATLVAGVAQAQWKVVEPAPKPAEKMRMAAFLNTSFGLSGGAGDVGKAHLTSDGGQTWSIADSSGG